MTFTPPPSRADVELWLARPDDWMGPDAMDRWRRVVSADELVRLDRYLFEKDRRLFLTARVLLRLLLSGREKVAPSDWGLSGPDQGRPYVLAPPTDWRFNLSHTQGLVCCVLARGRMVGVDVERWDRPGVGTELARYSFSPREARLIAALPPHERGRAFVDYWTLKESYAKARGEGLALPMDRFSFESTGRDGVDPVVTFDPELNDDPARWRFFRVRPHSPFAIAVAAEQFSGAPVTLSVRDADPEELWNDVLVHQTSRPSV